MLDKISNQKLFFISLIGIVVTSMILTTTFAYQSLGYTEAGGANSNVAIEAGKLDVKYCRNDECVDPNESENNYNKISVDNLSFLPDYKTASYVEFVVDNTSSSDDVAYMISLTDLVYNKMFVSEAFKYTVVVVNEDGTLTEIITDNFSTLTGDSFDLNLEDRIYKYIEKGKTERVRIYLWLDENVDVQLDLTDTSERKFTGVVNVSSIFEGEIANPLLYRRLINSAKLASLNEDKTRTVYNDTFDLNNITSASSETDKMLALAEDDYGTSYVYRGNVVDNYVSFAGFIWRIVRVNGDGSIRLILDKTLGKVIKNGESSPVHKNEKLLEIDNDGLVPFKLDSIDDNAYVGYMYGEFETNSINYDEAHKNINDSVIKSYVDTFFEEYLLNYQVDYLADTLFCGDKTTKENGFGINDTLYGTHNRLNSVEFIPSLECASKKININSSLTDEQLSYSRYTSTLDNSNYTKKGVLVNNSLKYPIALLTADELAMAGAFYKTPNTSYYLYDVSQKGLSTHNWWTMSPAAYRNGESLYVTIYSFYDTAEFSIETNNVSTSKGVRPVINLKSSLLWGSGDGTQDKPYEVKLSE